MANYVTMIALGKWEDRATLSYVPVNEKLNGRRYNAFGVAIVNAGDPAEVRRPYKIEEDGTTSYVMYDDDTKADVPIYKTVEA